MNIMRQPTATIALTLALLSGFALAQLWSMDPMRLQSIQAIPSSQVEATTLEFYAAVNVFLDQGDDASLRRILHPEFVNHRPGGSAFGNTEDFLQQLGAIRDFSPGIQLDPTVTPLSPNAASVALSWKSMEQRDFAGIAIGIDELIGPLDLIRSERGLIVERWSSAALEGQLGVYPALSLDLPVSIDTLVARVRDFTLQSEYKPTTNLYAHMVLIDLSSDAFLEVLHPVAVPGMIWKLHRGRVDDPAPIESARMTALEPMEAVFLPAGTTFRMWNAGDEQARFVVLEFGPPVVGPTPQQPRFLDDQKPALWSGVELQDVGDRLVLSFGQAALQAGATVSSPSVEGLQLTWVSSGTIDMNGTHGEARIHRAGGLRTQLVDGHAVLQSGDSGVAGPESAVIYRTPGDGSSTIWFFSIVPVLNPTTTEKSDTVMGTPAAPTPHPIPRAW